MLGRVLIIKHGAMGDVVRTTSLLKSLSKMRHKVVWKTSEQCLPLLPKGYCEATTSYTHALKYRYDMVLSLDEEFEYASLASHVKANKLIGACYNRNLNKVVYTASSAPWFDMSLISRLGKEKADKLKWSNRKSYQEILFNVIDVKFNADEYTINEDLISGRTPFANRIGLETTAGERWSAKRWGKYRELEHWFHPHPGLQFDTFMHMPTIKGYVKMLEECCVIVTGDTLAMHLGLALGKRVIGLFTCTSPHEIFGYGRLKKIVSKNLKQCFYKTNGCPDNKITVDEVAKAVLNEVEAYGEEH